MSHEQTTLIPPAPQPTAAGRPLYTEGQSLEHVIMFQRRNCKIADVSQQLEDFDDDYFYVNDQPNNVKCTVTRTVSQTDTGSEKSLTVDPKCPTPRPSSVLRDCTL